MPPGFVCDESVKAGALVPLLRGAVQELVPLFVVHPQRRHLPAPARFLHDFLVARLRG